MAVDVLPESDWFLDTIDFGRVVSFDVEVVPFDVEVVLVRGIVFEEEDEVVEYLEVLWDLLDTGFSVDI